jgi:hypothetical protein
MKAEALTRPQLATLHSKFKDSPFAANRFLAVISKCFAWGAARGLMPEGRINPARGIERYYTCLSLLIGTSWPFSSNRCDQ